MLFLFAILFMFNISVEYSYAVLPSSENPASNIINTSSLEDVDNNIKNEEIGEKIYKKDSTEVENKNIDIGKIVDSQISQNNNDKDKLPKTKKLKKKKSKTEIDSEVRENKMLKGEGKSSLNENGNKVKLSSKNNRKTKKQKTVTNKFYQKVLMKYDDVYVELKNPKFIENVDGNRNVFFIYNPTNIDENILDFVNNYLYMFKPIEIIKFRSKNNYKYKDFLEFTQKVVLESNMVVVNKFYDRINNQYFYNIAFLSGDINNKLLPFNRNYKETPENKINLFDKVSVISDSAVDDSEEAYVLEKKQILLKTKEIVGYWKDYHTGVVYDIRKIDKEKTLLNNTLYKNNEKVFDSNGEELEEFTPIYYAVYLIYSKNYLNAQQNNYDWARGDFVFEFEKVSGVGVNVYENKSLGKVTVKAYEEKGYIQIKMPNGASRYLIPAEELSQKTIGRMYKLKFKKSNLATEETYVDYLDRDGFFNLYNFNFAKYVWAVPLIITSVFLAFTVIM